MSNTIQEGYDALKRALETGFYGEISFTIRDGEITLRRRVETSIPASIKFNKERNSSGRFNR